MVIFLAVPDCYLSRVMRRFCNFNQHNYKPRLFREENIGDPVKSGKRGVGTLPGFLIVYYRSVKNVKIGD